MLILLLLFFTEHARRSNNEHTIVLLKRNWIKIPTRPSINPVPNERTNRRNENHLPASLACYCSAGPLFVSLLLSLSPAQHYPSLRFPSLFVNNTHRPSPFVPLVRVARSDRERESDETETAMFSSLFWRLNILSTFPSSLCTTNSIISSVN